ncbi:hypothetical protein ABPG77_009937 [Micractinium sp. CCAP 211/92]
MSGQQAQSPAHNEQRPQEIDRDTALSIEAALASFEARCDSSDPQQAALLAEMRRQSALLRHARGDWEAPASVGRRNWNAAPKGRAGAAPAAIQSLRDYKEHLAAERRRQQQPALLEGPEPVGITGGRAAEL